MHYYCNFTFIGLQSFLFFSCNLYKKRVNKWLIQSAVNLNCPLFILFFWTWNLSRRWSSNLLIIVIFNLCEQRFLIIMHLSCFPLFVVYQRIFQLMWILTLLSLHTSPILIIHFIISWLYYDIHRDNNFVKKTMCKIKL